MLSEASLMLCETNSFHLAGSHPPPPCYEMVEVNLGEYLSKNLLFPPVSSFWLSPPNPVLVSFSPLDSLKCI